MRPLKKVAVFQTIWMDICRPAGLIAFLFYIFPTAGLAAEPIATAEGEQAGVRIHVTKLERASGDTLTLEFSILNESDEEVAMPFNNQVVDETYIIDAVGRQKYLTLSDAEGECVCSQRVGSHLAPGEAKNLWAKFPAPPADVQEVSVVFPRFIPTDVPISE